MRTAEFYGELADVCRHCAAAINGASTVVVPVSAEFAEALHRFATDEGFAVTRIPGYRDKSRVVLRIAAAS